ncbi:MAG TPA: hypothetical protein VE999_19065 [Gemmataceae bacterium]|nr:hypothetical protein [Gemmataceae bacterium]
MRRFTFLCLLAIISVLSRVQAAPAPKRTNAKPAVINVGTEKNIAGILENVVSGARVGVRENEKVANMDIVRRQKDWESWLKKNLRVERVKDTNLVHVSFQDGNAKEQAAIINVVVDYYIKTDVGRRRETFTKSLQTARAQLEALRTRKRVTPDQISRAEERIKTREEQIRMLPALVEHAKAP